MYSTSQMCPSGSWKLRPYMKPWSLAKCPGNPPAARALSTSSSTSSSTRCLLSTPSARIASVLFVASGVLVGERLEERLHQQHGVDVVADDHASRVRVGELRIE